MITWIRKRAWIKRAMKELSKDSKEYKLLNSLQFTIKIFVNSRYRSMIIHDNLDN